MISDREQAAFEAGIKLGALYHQWVGTPLSRVSAASVEAAIEKAVILQPCVEKVSVRLNRNLMTPNRFGYSEVSGLMLDIEIVTRVRFAYCRAQLVASDGYPLMRIVECNEISPVSDH